MNKIDDTVEIDTDDYDNEEAYNAEEEFYDDAPDSEKLNPLLALGLVVGGTLALVLVAVVLPMNLASSNGDKAVLTTVEEIAGDVRPSSSEIPGADTYLLGEVDADGEFAQFENNIAPGDVTNFVVRVMDEDVPQRQVDVETEKPSGVVVSMGGVPARAGHFTVSAFNPEGKAYIGPDFLPGQSATYNSLTYSLEVY